MIIWGPEKWSTSSPKTAIALQFFIGSCQKYMNSRHQNMKKKTGVHVCYKNVTASNRHEEEHCIKSQFCFSATLPISQCSIQHKVPFIDQHGYSYLHKASVTATYHQKTSQMDCRNLIPCLLVIHVLSHTLLDRK